MALQNSYIGDPRQQQMPGAGAAASPPLLSFDALRREYRSALSELTFNSKPIITQLTIMAQENAHASRVITQVLEEHIRSVAPPFKLPALYLLDSICKNIGGPYISTFGRNIVRTFLDAYTLVDPPTRHKLETLFNTWISGLGQGPIFPRDQLATIERALARSRPVGGVHVNPQYVPPQPAYGYPPVQADDKMSLLHDIQTLLVQKNSRLLMRPDDQVNQSQITALNQLRSLIQSTHLNPDQIASTRQQLNSLFEEDELVAPVVQSPYRHTPPPPAALSNLGIAAAAAPAGADLDLISSLVQAGLLKVDMTPANEHTLIMAPKSSSHVSAAIAERDSIRLTNADIQHKRPNVVHLLYGALPLPCTQCGLRFPGTDRGEKEHRTHLDWHFRQNRRVREGLNRGQSRSWFLAEEDWISFKDTPYEDQPEQDRAGSQEPGLKANGTTPAPASGPSRAELEAKYVVAPTDAEIARQPCPICREMFVSVWNEDDEEWIWKNAVNINGKIYHATCHEDARRSALKDPQRRRSQSRSVTPETSSAKKRKVEEVLPKVVEEEDNEGERSAKRVASAE